MLPNPLSRIYNPHIVEDSTYALWEKSGFFNPDSFPKTKKSFSIAMPPPNATGNLHIGHAMMLAIQDLMIRYHRMLGDKTLWLPGTDHASIATQNKVERLLAKDGLTRQQLGRGAFLKRIYDYIEESRGTIRNQIRKMGSSCDWSRECYTLDERLSRAVSEIFVRMYQDGLIYRDTRIVNWCPRCLSTLSDDEVEHLEMQGKLYFIKYQNRSHTASIIVATTRPETMLGDVAVAVHPEDARYKKFIGTPIILPVGMREIPVIADEYVDMQFGSGALKITPAHDTNDFIIGKKYNLQSLKIMTDEGTIDLTALKKLEYDTASLVAYEGLDRFEAREKIVEDLQKNSLIEKIEDYTHSVGHCYRCDTVIEPLTSLQWFVAVTKKSKKHDASLKELALDTIKSGKTKILPNRFEKIYFNWIDNLKDWCISRQIPFGHQLPVYYCEREHGGCGTILVTTTPPVICEKCKNQTIRRDEDTLDTWFSSGIWTFSTLGWPDAITEKGGTFKKRGDLLSFHPTSVLETGYDIIFFWVARMIMMSRYTLNEEPFKVVYLHGLVLDTNGRKMSKSHEETLIDPLDVIEKFGADAVRLSLLIGVTPGNNLRLNEEKIAGYRNFVNKLWNISRFILEYTPSDKVEEGGVDGERTLTLADAWILSRLNTTIKNVTNSIEAFRFSQAAEALRAFTWDELADWYLEIAKREKKDCAFLYSILEQVLTLWHPFMPFVTEELWKSFVLSRPDEEEKEHKEKDTLLIIHQWPKHDEKMINGVSEKSFSRLQDIIKSIRTVRAEQRIHPKQFARVTFNANSYNDLIEKNKDLICSLASAKEISIAHEEIIKPPDSFYVNANGVEGYLFFDGSGEGEKEKRRFKIQKEIDALLSLIEGIQKRLANDEFIKKAPQTIVEQEKKKLSEYENLLLRLQKQL